MGWQPAETNSMSSQPLPPQQYENYGTHQPVNGGELQEASFIEFKAHSNVKCLQVHPL